MFQYLVCRCRFVKPIFWFYLHNCTICMSHQFKMHDNDNRKCHTEKPWLRFGVADTYIRSIYMSSLESTNNFQMTTWKNWFWFRFWLKSSLSCYYNIIQHANVQVHAQAYVIFCKQGIETWQRVVRCNDLFAVCQAYKHLQMCIIEISNGFVRKCMQYFPYVACSTY